MRTYTVLGLFAVACVISSAFAQDSIGINDEDIISAESINAAAEDRDLNTSPATVQYRQLRPFNYQQQQYQQQIRLQQQQSVQEEDERAEASQEESEEEQAPQQHIQQHIQQQPQQPQPAYRRPFQQLQQQAAQQEHPVFRKVEQNQKRLQNQNRERVREQHRQELEDELEQEEEPDRLALLLEKSDFQCNGRNTGYYADEGLNCEVFHYCADNQKHSWICPEGFSFHQVHLICMPAGNDNVCQQSSKYTFVNEYLYKPLNMEEHQQKPNVMLRYSERYFPEEIFQDERQEYDEEEYNARSGPQYRQPVQQQQQQRQQPISVALRRQPVTAALRPNPVQQVQQHQQQVQPQAVNSVFRNPEDINIPLQQRRPTFYQPTTPHYGSDASEQEEEEY